MATKSPETGTDMDKIPQSTNSGWSSNMFTLFWRSEQVLFWKQIYCWHIMYIRFKRMLILKTKKRNYHVELQYFAKAQFSKLVTFAAYEVRSSNNEREVNLNRPSELTIVELNIRFWTFWLSTWSEIIPRSKSVKWETARLYFTLLLLNFIKVRSSREVNRSWETAS